MTVFHFRMTNTNKLLRLIKLLFFNFFIYIWLLLNLLLGIHKFPITGAHWPCVTLDYWMKNKRTAVLTQAPWWINRPCQSAGIST